MGIGGIAAGVGAAASVGELALNASNGSGGGSAYGTYGGNPGTYIPTAQPQADQLYQSIFNQMSPYASALPGQVIPQYQQLYSNVSNNPYASGAQTGSNNAAGYGPALGGYGAGGASSLYGAGNQVLQTAMDPQTALYNQLQQQTTDQSNATNSMYGLGSSPYGAGVANQNMQNLNLNWQNQQLQRQAQGIQSAAGAYGTGLNVGGQGATDVSTLAGLPSQTYLGQQTQNLSALQALTGGYNSSFGPQESLANLLQSYLGLGQSATGLAQQGQAQQFAQNQTTGQNLATALTNPALANLFSGAGNLFNGTSNAPGTVYGASDYYGGGYSDPYASSDYSYGVPLAY